MLMRKKPERKVENNKELEKVKTWINQVESDLEGYDKPLRKLPQGFEKIAHH